MKPARLFLAVAGLVLSLTIVLLAVVPGSVLRPVANVLLDDYGVSVTAIDELQLGWSESSASRLRLQFSDGTVVADDMRLGYSLAELLGEWRVDTIAVGGMTVTVVESNEPDQQPMSAASAITDLAAALESLPFAQLRVDEFRLTGRAVINGSFSATTSPLRLDAELTSADWPDWEGAVVLRQLDSRSATGTLALRRQGSEVAATELSFAVENDQLTLLSDTSVDLPALVTLAPSDTLPGNLELLDETLLISGELQVPLDIDSGVVSLLGLEVTTVDRGLNWRTPVAGGSVQGELLLPLSVTGALDLSVNRWNVNLGTAQTDLSVRSEQFNGEARAILSDLRLRCDFQAQCSAESQTDLALPVWEAAGLGGEGMRLAGVLEVARDNDGLSLHAANLTLGIANLSHEQASAALELVLQDLEFTAGNEIRASVRTSSRALDIELPGIELLNPSIDSDLALAGNRLRGTADISLDQRANTSLSFNHDLDSGAGDLSVMLETVRFSAANPLSTLVNVQDINADIVAGAISGSGEFAWQQVESDWQLTGPISVNMDALSGLAADVYFVGFNSVVQARVQDGTLQSTGLLPASVATVDVGLPMNQINWRYGFDLAAGTFSISELRTDMLGGTVEIPDFVYTRDARENRLRVVLSRLDLATIVALANYPNLQVEGSVSGYLPLLVTADGVVLEAGLVSALDPGGRIRYTSTTGTSSNASVELLNEALSNYRFETLNAELEYGADGDLDMGVQLRGSNPDMRGGQPINLNVNIADNIPTLLRSLQAGRLITEQLEQRLNRQ